MTLQRPDHGDCPPLDRHLRPGAATRRGPRVGACFFFDLFFDFFVGCLNGEMGDMMSGRRWAYDWWGWEGRGEERESLSEEVKSFAGSSKMSGELKRGPGKGGTQK